MLPPTSLGLEQFPVDAPLTVSPAGYSPAGSLNEAIRIGAQYQPPIGRENDGGRAQPVRADNVRRGEGDVWRGSGQEAQARHGFGGVRVEYIPASTRALFPGQGDECGFYGTILLDLADPIRRIVLRPRRAVWLPMQRRELRAARLAATARDQEKRCWYYRATDKQFGLRGPTGDRTLKLG